MFRFIRWLTGCARRLFYPGSIEYWQQRYAGGGDSGAGSGGPLARFKADFLNEFVRKHNVRTVLEFGCGDGQQLALADYADYTGLDVAPAAVQRCRIRFASEPGKRFLEYDPHRFDLQAHSADLTLSLEVLFHLTEDAVYHLHLTHLFGCAMRFVIVFATDHKDETGGIYPHFKPRQFTPDIPSAWRLVSKVDNPFPERSASSFFVFEKIV